MDLYTRTLNADELVLLTRLIDVGHAVLLAGGYPDSVIERTEALQLRIIGDFVTEGQPA